MDKIEVSPRVPEVRLEQLAEDRAIGAMRMSFITCDPLESAVDSGFFEQHPSMSPMLLPVARNELGGAYALPTLSTLIAGATGSGKGGMIQAVLRKLAPRQRNGLVRLYGADPKRADLSGIRSHVALQSCGV
jgi:hypothetical protein